MLPRRSLKWPILLAVAMIGLLAVLAVGWVLSAVFGALGDRSYAPLHWTLLSIGATFIVLLLAGTIIYLVLSIKAINLTRRQSNFIDSVTHELKSPLASMKLCLQTLSRHQVSGEERTDFLRIMLDDIERLDRLTDQLLDAGKLNAARPPSELEQVALDRLLADCADSVCRRYRLPPETVHLDLQPCSVLAAAVDVEVIFRNLLDNAVKYAGEEPRVDVTLRCGSDGWVAVQIADNGRGIPQALRRAIFGRFVRLGSELEREKPGTGLGLYIVRTAVKRLGGRIRVRGREPQPGTEIEVQIPARR
ncbi:MAG: HAMP domain-containing sensor histidine kinase [Thermoguttaceae bacterium]|jgi:signal transduction histidine kinase|nr:HAMP domain-containing sensor histidine kinase [Thermoguttaceae bacterium]